MFKKLAIGIICIVILIPALWLSFPYYTARTVEITVTDKERVPDGEHGSYYLVFTDGEVFQNVDVWRRFKTTSSDLQGRLQVGKTFRVTAYGWRIPILSKYRNIVLIQTEITPAMTIAVSLPDLEPRVERTRETRLPSSLLFPQTAHPKSMADALNGQFSSEVVRVFGEEPSDFWGIMIYWDHSLGTIIEATPLKWNDTRALLEWSASNPAPN